jgi:hypothetical protein
MPAATSVAEEVSVASERVQGRVRPFAERNGGDRPSGPVRVLVVGSDVPEEALSSVAGAHVVGCTSADELVPAFDVFRPDVLLFSPGLADLAARMSSCPAAVVVASSTDPEWFGSPVLSTILELSLRLAVACP